jgi:hypothetical protein
MYDESNKNKLASLMFTYFSINLDKLEASLFLQKNPLIH